MKFATRLKQTASALSSTTLSVGVIVTLGAAATNCRTLAQAISDGAAASDTTAIQVGDTGIPFVFDDGSNWMEAYCTITSTTQITITSIISGSSGGTSAVTFAGALPTVFNAIPGKWLRTVVASTDGVAITDFTAVTPTGTTYDSYLFMMLDPATGTPYKVSVAALKTLFASAPAATVTSVSVSPSTVSLAGNGTQTFTATVTGTNSPAQTVTWTTTAGSITAGGVLTAPAATASTQTITVTATSTVDTSKSGTATVTIAATGSTVSGVSISPTSASLTGGGTQTFTATVAGTNSPSQSVTWAVTTGGGSITSGGVYTAPAATASVQNIVITATSVQDNTKSTTAAITVAAATVTSVAVTPASPSVTGGSTQQFSATVTGTNSPPQTVTWSTTAGSITTGGLFTAPASTASAQTVTVTATSTLDGTKSGTATITVPATVATMAQTYKVRNGNAASMVASTTTATLSSPDYYASPTSSIRVNVRDSSGNACDPTKIKLVFGLYSDSSCPVTNFAQTGLQQGANGTQNSGGHSNGLVGVQTLNWTYGGATSQSNYGTMQTSASMFAWFGTAAPVGAVTSGQVIDMKLWVIFNDNSAQALQVDDASAPTKFSFTVP